uniref:Amidohydrolase n=1 Tax=Eiseniibacteriota bacterium TaxID=2212470 RepID=A0A832MIP5_UNCEI
MSRSLIVRNARVWTGGAPVPGADCVRVERGRIAAVGAWSALPPRRPGVEVLDARGATVTPGLCDAHLHLLAWARSLDELDLHGASSAAACAAEVAARARARPAARAIVGRGWDPHDWPDRPHRALLDAACPDRPVVLHAHDFHAVWVNGAALAAAGVGARPEDPPGGRFERDADGAPDGVVREHAVRPFQALADALRDADDGPALEAAVARLHAAGVTAVHDFEGRDAFALLAARAVRRGARLRVLAQLPHAALDAALALGLASGVGDRWLRVGAVKLFADGTLGSRTAAMLEPYDGAGGTGMDLLPPEVLAADVRRALEGGLAVAVHAIGDRAVRHVVDAFESAGAALARPALPSRVEHVQIAHPADLARLARLGLVASMQPSHCASDLPLAERYWGSRRARCYPWRAVLDLGAALVFGSDAPVEPPDPAAGLHAAVTRQRRDGTPAGGWVPEQRVSLDAALAAYTEAPARAAGWWPRVGALRLGADADLVVWNRDLHALPPERLHAARPVATVIAGEVVWRAEGSSGGTGEGGAPRARAAGPRREAP